MWLMDLNDNFVIKIFEEASAELESEFIRSWLEKSKIEFVEFIENQPVEPVIKIHWYIELKNHLNSMFNKIQIPEEQFWRIYDLCHLAILALGFLYEVYGADKKKERVLKIELIRIYQEVIEEPRRKNELKEELKPKVVSELNSKFAKNKRPRADKLLAKAWFEQNKDPNIKIITFLHALKEEGIIKKFIGLNDKELYKHEGTVRNWLKEFKKMG